LVRRKSSSLRRPNSMQMAKWPVLQSCVMCAMSGIALGGCGGNNVNTCRTSASTQPVALVQLGQTKGHGMSNVEGANVDANQAMEYVLSMADKVAGHNYTLSRSEKSAIATVKAFITQLLEDIKTQRHTDQRAVNSSAAVIQGCAQTAADELAEVQNMKQTVDGARQRHAICRNGQVTHADEATAACKAYDEFRKSPPGNDPPQCMCQLTSSEIATDEETQKGAMEDCLAKIVPLVERYQHCENGKGLLANKSDTCKEKQKEFEGEFCQYSRQLVATCNTQVACRSKAVREWNEMHIAVKVSEAARAADCKVGHKVQCLLEIFEEKNNSLKPGMLAKCNASTPTCPDSIVYPGIPDSTRCTPEAHQPCDVAWLKTEYEHHAWYSKAPAGKCTPWFCKPTTTTTTPAAYRPPLTFKERCDHDPAWIYVLDYSDDRSKDDIPNDFNLLVGGFANENAYYMGNEKLDKLNIKEAEMCILSSITKTSTGQCQSSCMQFGEDQKGDAECMGDSLGSPVTMIIAALSGQIKGQCSRTGDLLQNFDVRVGTFQEDFSSTKWNCRGVHKRLYGQADGRWHAEGWGVTLTTKNTNKELGWYDGTCGYTLDPDTFQVRVKLQD